MPWLHYQLSRGQLRIIYCIIFIHILQKIFAYDRRVLPLTESSGFYFNIIHKTADGNADPV